MLIRSKENTFTARFAGGDESVFLKGIALLEILEFIRPPNPDTIVLAKVNNRVCNLHESEEDNCSIEWIHLEALEAIRSYQKTLCFVFLRAVQELYPDCKIRVEQFLVNGLYWKSCGGRRIGRRMVNKIKTRMQEIIRNDESIQPVTLLRNQAMAFFDEVKQRPILFLENQERARISLYQSGKFEDYLGYPLFHSTGYLRCFDLQYRSQGMLLIFPESHNLDRLSPHGRQETLFKVYDEYNRWKEIIGFQEVGDVNDAVGEETISDMIQLAEGIHEKKIAAIADMVIRRRKRLRIVLVVGPSSSGRDVFTQRLGMHLRVNGFKPIIISVKDYFLDDEQFPEEMVDDFKSESSRIFDASHLNDDLKRLLRGEKVQLPRYDTEKEKRILSPPCRLGPQQTIFVQGSRNLFDQTVTEIARNAKLYVYIDVLTHLNITNHLRIDPGDVGVLRCLIRHHYFRNLSVEDTITHWPQVCDEKDEKIYFLLKESNIIFNSFLFYEPCVLRVMGKPILAAVKPEHPSYPEAQRLLQLLLCFSPVSSYNVPSNSILREYIGSTRFDSLHNPESVREK